MTQDFGNDHGDGTLDETVVKGLTGAEFVKDILSTDAFDTGLQHELQGFDARILKRHLRKVIIEYTLKFKDSTRNYVGLYRESDARLQHSFSVMKELVSNGFDGKDGLGVPCPIFFMPSLSFLMMEKAEGDTLRQIFESEKDPATYVKGAAQWLARLHNSSTTIDLVRTPDEEISTSLRYARAGSWVFPNRKSEIEAISNKLVRAQKAFHIRGVRPIHGDYHPRNIIVNREMTTVIDFEEASMGDPAFDIGYFTAQTKMTHGRGDTITQAIETFVQEYQENSISMGADFAQRASIFEAQTYLQRIYHTYYLLALKPDLEKVSEWLSESENCLRRVNDRHQPTRATEA